MCSSPILPAPPVEFDTPLTFFGNIRDREQLDIKKGGIFPIVHGVRTLALEHRILATNTYRRIEALVEGGQLPEKHGNNLAEALSLFIQLRLRQQMCRMEDSDDGFDPTPNLIELQRLDKMERGPAARCSADRQGVQEASGVALPSGRLK